MTRDVIYVSPVTGISEVADIIFRNKFHAVPVVDNSRVVGIITEDDFFLKGHNDTYLPAYIRMLEQNRAVDRLPADAREKISRILDARARDFMTANVTCVSPEMNVSELIELVKKTRFTTLPVADAQKNLLGIVTTVDVVGTMRDGYMEARKSLPASSEVREIDKLIHDIHPKWRDEFVTVSKDQMLKWKIVAFGSLAIAVLALALLAYLLSIR